MKKRIKYILILTAIVAFGGIYRLNADRSLFSMQTPEITPIEEIITQDTVKAATSGNQAKSAAQADTSLHVRYPVSKTVPEKYDDVTKHYPIDLQTPETFADDFVYDPVSNRYILKSEIGGMDVTTPFSLTPEEYMKYSFQRSMDSYFRKRNLEEYETKGEKKDALSGFDFKFDLGPAEKLFGPGGVKLTAQGSVDVKTAVTRTSNGNPTLSETQRNRTTFDFDTKIQANVNASVGDKINFGMNYNTESTFDFDSKKLNLGYQGKEDEIIKTLEAGNVSMNTTNSLINGGAALFGIKTELQFGKLNVGAIFSQQESQSRTISSQGKEQTVPFEMKLDAYDENRHFFLSHYFRDIYDNAMKTLPAINSGILITRVEVWVTNKRSNFDQARDIVAFSDLGEHLPGNIGNDDFVQPNYAITMDAPDNKSNNLYDNLITNYPNVRDISLVDQSFKGTSMESGRDYNEIEDARKLTQGSEYVLNAQLGYISLTGSMLQPDEVLAVAFEYQYAPDGQTYQVGEFSTDDPQNTKQNLYLKLLKGVAMSPEQPFWDLMMKNIYSLNASSIQNDKFKLNIKYQNDTTGNYLNYIPEGDIANQLLLRVMNLDRLDARGNANPDGYFDFVEGYTILSQTGKIIFPEVEPFGSHLRKKIGNDDIADKYVFQQLYDSTLTVAQQNAERNKFVMSGEYKGSTAGIDLGGSNIARGSVRVTANGVKLIENVHYTVDYTTGNVTVIDPTYANSKIEVQSENQSNFGMQRKTLMGLNLSYSLSPDFILGATVMNLREMPLTMKVNMGDESVNNTIYGFNFNYKTQWQWLTNLIDKLPFIEATAPSQLSINGEFAQLLPGHYESELGGNYSYIDDFERSKVTIDLRAAYNWNLAATPYGDLFDEASLTNDVRYGYNRALLAWYYIDGLFTRSSSMTPTHIKNDTAQLSNHYVRQVYESELFPYREPVYTEQSTIPVLNLAFYPNERGPYNLDGLSINPDGTLMNPQKRWGGITRKIENGQTDFEASNVEHIEFWLLDPFIYKPQSAGGDLYFNLGEVSEDVLKDEKKFFENGLPLDRDPSKVDTTAWGVVPNTPSLNSFDNTTGARQIQDVGLNGLNSEEEKQHPSYVKFLEDLQTRLNSEAWENMLNDRFSPRNNPSGDLYHYFRGSDYDDQETSILDRYKHYNGTEGNSVDSENSPEKYNTAAKLSPDIEDINQDNTLNKNERYFQYKISVRPGDLAVGKNHIVEKRDASVQLKNGTTQTVSWYQFKIPIREYEKKIGNIRDFKTIRFARMFLTNFADTTILRFGTLELVRGDWRTYTQDISNPNMPSSGTGVLSMSTVNLEENSDKEPVNYVLPPGVSRILDPSQPQLRQQNEQSLSMKITNLESGDARAIYKNSGLDMRQYRRLQMFSHAEKLPVDDTNLQDNELSIFLRLGSDYKNNYYEYEIPLKVTPPPPSGSKYSLNSTTDRETVWPESNMFDFPFEILTDLKLQRNKEKRKEGSGISYQTPYSTMDPNKPMNRITVVGNPSIADVKIIMVGVRNNSMSNKSSEIWINELRLTEFNEDGGWAANGNVFLGLSDLGTVNFQGRKQTAGFGSIDQGIMERSIDDTYQYNISTTIDAGRLFPEKAKVTAPFYYSYSEDVISPKYNPLDQDVLLKDALDAMDSKTEKDSLKNIAQEKVTTKSIGVNNFKVDIRSKNPMPYDPANFTLGYVFSETNKQDATTTYERTTDTRAMLNYMYSPMIKTVEPFKGMKSKSGFTKFMRDFGFNYLPGTFGFTSDITRNYYEVQLRDLNSPDQNLIQASFREDFYWDRGANLSWNLTKNLNFTINTGTQARIDAPHVQVNKKYNGDQYSLWKDSVLQSIKDLGTPLNYNQVFSASYNVPFKSVPILNFISGTLAYNATYNWEKGAQIETDEFEMGNTIRNERTMGISNLGVNFLELYNKVPFLVDANKKYSFKRPANTTSQSEARRRSTQQRVGQQAAQRDSTGSKKPERKKFESEVTLNTDSATLVKHQLDNKRLRVTARGENGRLYELKFKAIDKNTIEIKNKDSVKLKLAISQLPPLEETTWYKVAQVAARGLMMVRSAGLSYNLTSSSTVPNFGPNVGDFLGQGNSASGKAPGWDFAFGLTDEGYLDKAKAKGWIMDNNSFITPAIFGETEVFTFRAALEPIVGLKVDLTADRTTTNRQQYNMSSYSKTYNGTFQMSTIAIGSAFETYNADNGYRSKTFEKFLSNRQVIYNRLENAYAGTSYPNAGFITGTEYAGQPFNPQVNDLTLNSTDVLIPAFIAAYTGKNPNKIGLTAFPSLSQILPNWTVNYNGLMQLELFNNHFKDFVIRHQYVSRYLVGSYTSYGSWVEASDGLGFIKSQTSGPIPSSPYEISAASITEQFNPLIAVEGTFRNNMTMKLGARKTRNINLNVSSYQIVEITADYIDMTLEYKLSEFNKVLKIKRTGGDNFSNDLKLAATLTFQRTSNLIRKIQDALTLASAGESQTIIRLSADYNLSRALTIQAFYDRNVNRPLVSTTSYPMSKSSFGVNINLSLMR